jgi:hypothetical protein
MPPSRSAPSFCKAMPRASAPDRRSPPASRNFPQPAGKHRPLTG